MTPDHTVSQVLLAKQQDLSKYLVPTPKCYSTRPNWGQGRWP